MKNNFFEMLLNLFEKSLTQLQKSHQSTDEISAAELYEEDGLDTNNQLIYVRAAQQKSTRVLTDDEQLKLTQSSYQFLMPMKLWHLINLQEFEAILNQLYLSDSRIVTLQETKWTIRTVLATNLNEKQLAFLDLVLYQAEDELTAH